MSLVYFDVPAGSTLPIDFSTFAKTTGASITMSGLAVTDIEVYKGTSMTQRASDNGYTLLETDGIDIDGTTGIHGFSIDLSDNSDAGFYAAGSFYRVIVSAITVDGETVSFIAARFRIVAAENSAGTPVVDVTRVDGITLGTHGSGYLPADVRQYGGTAGTFSSGRPEVNTSHVGGTSQTAGDIIGDTNDIQARLPAALVGGRMDSNMGAISEDATAADNAEAFFDGTGYAGTGNVIPTVTTLTNDPSGVTTLLSRMGTPSNLGSGATVAANLVDIEAYADDIPSIATATNAGDLASKTADSGDIVGGVGTVVSGTYASTASNDDVYWITAPVTPAVSGFGLRQNLVFNLPTARVPTMIHIRGYWNGSGQVGDVYALNSRTGVYDKLTNTGTNLASRSSELLYTLPLPRDYADDNGVNSIVTLEFRSSSTNTAHRLRLDQVLVYHVAEATVLTFPTAADIWTFPERTLSEPGVEPGTAPTAAEVASAVRTNLTVELGRIDVAVSSVSSGGGASAADVATAVGTLNCGGKPLTEAVRIVGAMLAGKTTGAGTATETFLDFSGVACVEVRLDGTTGPVNRQTVTYK